MERTRRAASKVTDFRRFHLSGNLEEEVNGLVDYRIEQFEMALTPEQMKQQVELEKDKSRKMQEDVKRLQMQTEMDTEKMKQEQWRKALEKLKEAREQAAQDHEKCLEEIEAMAHTNIKESASSTLEWLRTQISKSTPTGPPHLSLEAQETLRREQGEKSQAIQELKAQQAEINQKLAEVEGTDSREDPTHTLRKAMQEAKAPQEAMMPQLRSVLSGKKEEDPNKAMLRVLLTQQNKTMGAGGANTLKTNILNRLSQEDNTTMADWLADLDRQKEGESDFSKFPFPGEDVSQPKPTRVKSGILDRATSNIQQKQVWPQQNLGEDWADEEVEFKQLRFEHLVAGETRTIETCSEPAEILGRQRLLRRISYLKLRG